MLVDYLLENYIVWPWGISEDGNKARVKTWWDHVFSDLLLPDLQIDDCPMLIGVTLHGLREESRYPLSKYHSQVLQQCDLLPQTEKRSTLENLLQIFRTFKEESLRSQQFLVQFDFVRSTKLCPDVVIEIIEYLSLVDTINAFSIGILPLLQGAFAKIHLVNPLSPLLEMIRQHLDPRQIVSLRITDDYQISTHDLEVFRTFEQLNSVTVLSRWGIHVIDHLRHFLPNLRRLSFWFDNESNSHRFRLPRDWSSPAITHLAIRCPNHCFIHFPTGYQPEHYLKNTTITSFVFDMEYYLRDRDRSLRYANAPLLVKSAFEFLGLLANVRRVRFVINRHRIRTFLRLGQWQQLIAECLSLERVIIQVVDNGDFTQEARNVEQALRQLRPGIVFRIKSP